MSYQLKRSKKHVGRDYTRYRQFPPSECRAGTFRTKKVSPEHEIVLCKKKGSKKQRVQSLLEKR
jgi:hypothetical protein